MSEWLNKAFSGSVSLKRADPVGIAVMMLAVALLAAEKWLSGKVSEEKRQSAALAVKISGLLFCAVGAMISIL